MIRPVYVYRMQTVLNSRHASKKHNNADTSRGSPTTVASCDLRHRLTSHREACSHNQTDGETLHERHQQCDEAASQRHLHAALLSFSSHACLTVAKKHVLYTHVATKTPVSPHAATLASSNQLSGSSRGARFGDVGDLPTWWRAPYADPLTS
jgi:hypothetical protein